MEFSNITSTSLLVISYREEEKFKAQGFINCCLFNASNSEPIRRFYVDTRRLGNYEYLVRATKSFSYIYDFKGRHK